MNYEGIVGTIGAVIASILAIMQTVEAVKKNKADKDIARVGAGKVDAERQDLEDRITERVLQRAEAELAKLKNENDKLRGENDAVRAENADAMRMMRAIRMITIKLVKKMEAAGIDPELTQEERDALYDTGKLTEFAKRQNK